MKKDVLFGFILLLVVATAAYGRPQISPREAVAFVFELKKVIRGELVSQRAGDEITCEISELERKIDEIALLAFQTYVQCREDLFEIRTRELKRRSDRLLHMVNATDTESVKSEDGVE